jgi:TPR repeat protein
MDNAFSSKQLWQTLVIFLCCFTAAGNSMAANSLPYLKNQAKNYYYGLVGGEQSYAKALQLYLQAAEAGDAEAQYISGGMYLKGLGTEKDFKKAFKLLHDAAKNGKSSAESAQILGQAFLLGSGVPKNYEKALQWYHLAAEKGSKEAQNELGFIYFVGNGVEQDVEKGGSFFIKAAYSGLVVAQYNVGIMYYTGRGVAAVDLEKAYGWLNLAAANGHQPARAARDYLETILAKNELAAGQKYSTELQETISP